MQDAHSILSSVFGFDSFRPGQAEIVSSVSTDQNVLAIMPTGGGKSLCYQLPALMRPGVTLVISPLIALMRDQVRSLQQAGVVAGALTSANTDAENAAIWDAMGAGRLKLLYVAPERLASGGAERMLRQANVSLIAVDEAHCVSQWGHDFRPDYLRIGALRRALNVPLAAFTATADAQTRAEIITRLFGDDTPQVFLRGFDRPNLTLAFAIKSRPREQIMDFAKARKGQSGIVYCGTRSKTQTLARALTQAGHSACFYHGGMDPDDRRVVERRFAEEDGLIVVATIAFGMGVDKPDIRWVAHADLPKSIESYYQEIGRAGRDGAAADTLTLFGADDIRFRRQQIDEGLAPPDRKAADHLRLSSLLGLAEALECRRKVLLGYFGEETEPCGNCDICAQPPETFDATTPVRKALSAILRTDEFYGSGHLIDILMGADTDKIKTRGHDRLPTYGLGTEFNKRGWQAVFRQMAAHDLVRPDPARHGALRMTDTARPILKGEATITFRKDTIAASSTKTAVKTLVADEDAPLLSALKAKRRALAEGAGLPAYMVFTDRTLIEMAETRPQSLDDMARITGIGQAKLDRYARDFLTVITGAPPAPMHPARRKLAHRGKGSIYDRLLAVQSDHERGPDGIDRPMRCSSTQLAKVVENKPANLAMMERLIGQRHTARFGQVFLDVLHDDA
jgi:ATP-dependent DNA helicase RecQ